jgi:hypothetical protein
MNGILVGLAGVAGAMATALRLRRGRTTTILVTADPESALLSSAAALRRLGARITRYDAETGTIEARVPPTAGIVRLRAAANDALTTRLRLEGDVPAVIRRFRDALSG